MTRKPNTANEDVITQSASNPTDRELLELAAKAAGERGRVVQRHYRGALVDVFERVVGSFWMPHLDDGDALRLAVALNLELAVFRDHVTAYYPIGWCDELHTTDRYAAARRAIVRAAAEIGRAMP